MIYLKAEIFKEVVVKIFESQKWVLRCNLVTVPLPVSPIVHQLRNLPDRDGGPFPTSSRDRNAIVAVAAIAPALVICGLSVLVVVKLHYSMSGII
jgi:hypothetical protein